jgi:SEL1 protein
VSLYRHSADQGNVASLLALGDAYLAGEGVEQDWVRSAAVYYEVGAWNHDV